MKWSGWGLLPVVAVAVVAPAAQPAFAQDEAWREFKGQVVVSDILLAPSFSSDELMITTLNRVKCTQVSSTRGFWRLHLVAFLDRAVDDDSVRIIARDITAPPAHPAAAAGEGPAAHKKPAAVKVFQVEAQPEQKVLQLNNLVLSPAMGFQPGHDYELTVEDAQPLPAPPGAPRGAEKRDVYARGVVTLR
jgi:hypothetical protein